MATETGRTKWSDERLDDLNQTMREGFDRTDRAIAGLRTEMRLGFARVDDRFDALQRTLILGLIGLIGTLLVVVIAAA